MPPDGKIMAQYFNVTDFGLLNQTFITLSSNKHTLVEVCIWMLRFSC